MRGLHGRVVVITGAASGIGRALAVHAVTRGANVALSDVDARGLSETHDLLQQRNAAPAAVRLDHLDVRDRAAWDGYAAAVVGQFGVVHVAINNAGVALNGDFLQVTEEQFEKVIDVDFWGVVHGTRAFLPHLIASGEGHLVNISSLFGLMGVPGQTAYNAAKFGVRGFTEALRQEMRNAGHPVGVTCVHPGGIKTAIARNAASAPGLDATRSAELFDATFARTSPERAAELIFSGIEHDRARVLIGRDARTLDLLVRVTGSGYQRLVAKVMKAHAERLGVQPDVPA